MHYNYRTKYTCSRVISLDIDNGVVRNVHFEGGCDGNLKAVARLIDGMTADEIAGKLAGITCGRKPTSCGDQLSQAVRAARDAEQAARAAS